MSQTISLPPSIISALPSSVIANLPPTLTAIPPSIATLLPPGAAAELPPAIATLLPPPPGPPYMPFNAQLGGISSKSVDVPLASVFLVLYLIAALANLYIFFANMRHSHKFIMNETMGMLSLLRVVTMMLRITEAYYPGNVRLMIATSILTLAGVLVLYVFGLLFSERLVRAIHPKFGWSKSFSIPCKTVLWLLPAILVMLITVFVLPYYTLDMDKKLDYLDASRGGQCYFLFVAVLPFFVIPISFAFPYKRSKIENFGSGTMGQKIALLLVGTAILTLGSAFRIAVSFQNFRPYTDPAWYQSKACYWVFNFTTEIVVIYLYVIFRIDRLFFVPNKSRQAGGYAAAYAALEASGVSTGKSASSSAEKV